MIFNHKDIMIKCVCATVTCFKKEKTSIPARPFDALTFRIYGKGVVTVGNQTISLDDGDVFFMPKNIEYQADYEDTKMLVVHFIADNSPLQPEKFTPIDKDLIREIFEKIIKSWKCNKITKEFSCVSLIYKLLEEMCNQYISSKTKHSKFDSALTFLNENFKNPETNIALACEHAKISTSYFRKEFDKRFDCSPIDYLTNLRIEHSHLLLSKGVYSINEIALMSGFGDAKYFARVIKKTYGCPPSKLFIV